MHKTSSGAGTKGNASAVRTRMGTSTPKPASSNTGAANATVPQMQQSQQTWRLHMRMNMQVRMRHNRKARESQHVQGNAIPRSAALQSNDMGSKTPITFRPLDMEAGASEVDRAKVVMGMNAVRIRTDPQIKTRLASPATTTSRVRYQLPD